MCQKSFYSLVLIITTTVLAMSAAFLAWFWYRDPMGILAMRKLGHIVKELDEKVIRQNAQIVAILQQLQTQIDRI